MKREAATARAEARTPSQKAADRVYAEVKEAQPGVADDGRLTGSRLFALLRTGEPLAEMGWQRRWQDEFVRLRDALAAIEDPRDRRGFRHPPISVRVIPILASICGRDGADRAHRWAAKNAAWLEEFLPLPHGIPTQDVFLRVYAAIDPHQFEVGCIACSGCRAWAHKRAHRICLPTIRRPRAL